MWPVAVQELAALPGQAVETPSVDDVVPLHKGGSAAEQALWRSDFFRDCMAPKVATFKVVHCHSLVNCMKALPYRWIWYKLLCHILRCLVALQL